MNDNIVRSEKAPTGVASGDARVASAVEDPSGGLVDEAGRDSARGWAGERGASDARAERDAIAPHRPLQAGEPLQPPARSETHRDGG